MNISELSIRRPVLSTVMTLIILLFGFIGYNPNSALFEGIIDMEHGYIKTDDNMHTNIEGVYAAGDIRVKSLRQVVTAAADGAIAAMQAEHYLANK